MSGSHRISRRASRGERRGAVPVLTGVAAGALLCGAAAVFVLTRSASGAEPGLTSQGMSAKNSTVPAPTERQAVPDACDLVSDRVARALVPEADRTQSDAFTVTDSHNQCVWSRFGDQERRQLTVELRAVPRAGTGSAADAAQRTLDGEREADDAGRGLPAGRKVTVKRSVKDVGESGYLTYSLHGLQRFGEAIVNVRSANVLVTVHYAGGNDAEAPLPSGKAIDGAVEATRDALTVLARG
ncbi:MAG TPA: hypothetical protein VGP70_24815 [Actinomadura sp.]|nr:hypothetical protein [Actinomadura sp.]